MIIAISGKIGSGKDTVAKMLQYLSEVPEEDVEYAINNGYLLEDLEAEPSVNSKWEIKKFADKIKDIVSILIGCSREQLEDREFKEKPLGEEWWYYNVRDNTNQSYIKKPYLSSDEDRLHYDWTEVKLIKLTPRKLMQLLGTEAGREIIHPDIWVNALFADYKPTMNQVRKAMMGGYTGKKIDYQESNWIISDMRFSNEFERCKKHGAFTIRVERRTEHRFPELYQRFKEESVAQEWGSFLKDIGEYHRVYHPSETSLDDVAFKDWDVVINNNGTITQLLNQVREIYESKLSTGTR